MESADLKVKTNRVTITSILPRMNDVAELKNICQSGVVYLINFIDVFLEGFALSIENQLHRNDIENARLDTRWT